jgi:hypothetical protein
VKTAASGLPMRRLRAHPVKSGLVAPSRRSYDRTGLIVHN